MRFSVETRDLTKVKTDLLVVDMYDGKIVTRTFANHVDKKLGGGAQKTDQKRKIRRKGGPN